MEPEIAWMQNEQEANANAGQQDGDGSRGAEEREPGATGFGGEGVGAISGW